MGFDARTLFDDNIRPEIEGFCPSLHPVTVFLGGQPAAGKTRAQHTLQNLYGNQEFLAIVGDDYRMLHPDYYRLLRKEPLRMPDATAQLAGEITGMAVNHADMLGISTIIEGTWRNRRTVEDEARRARRFGRQAHAAVVAVPPSLTRIGMLERFYYNLENGRPARWTPPDAHEKAVDGLPRTIGFISASRLFSRFLVLDGSGSILYEGADGGAFRTAWRKDFDRPLTDAEVSDLKRSIPLLMELHDEFTPFDREAPFVIDRVIRDQSPLLDDALPHYTTGGPTFFDDMPSARGGQPRAPAGRPDGGRWIPRAPSDSDL